MLKLFSVYLGGRAEKCNIELHDIVFVVNESIEAAYPQLVNKWFGSKKRLHIDAYIELTQADGHDILLSTEKSNNNNKLFFVYFGGYQENFFGEIHESEFYVGASKPEVLARAKKELCLKNLEPHCDDNIDVDDIIEIEKPDGYYLNLVPAASQKNNNMNLGYFRLDVPEIMDQALALQN